MDQKLSGKKIAMVATDGFEEAELLGPKQILTDAGAEVTVISDKPGEIKGWKEQDWGQPVKVDQTLDQADPNQFDALVLPGGVINADKIRANPKAVEFARTFLEDGKPVGAICHAPWLLVEA